MFFQRFLGHEVHTIIMDLLGFQVYLSGDLLIQAILCMRILEM